MSKYVDFNFEYVRYIKICIKIFDDLVFVRQPLQNGFPGLILLGLGGAPRMGVEFQLVEQYLAQLLGGVEVEFLACQLVDALVNGREFVLQIVRQHLDHRHVHADALVLHAREHRDQRAFDGFKHARSVPSPRFSAAMRRPVAR